LQIRYLQLRIRNLAFHSANRIPPPRN
jgi:hypothetical protein